MQKLTVTAFFTQATWSLSGSAVTSLSHSVRSLSGIGDASHSGAVTTETGDGVPNATVLNEAEQNEEDFTKTQPVKISFRYLLTPRTILNWHTLLINDNLYIEIPKGCLPDASKEAFVALLEYAEDVLHCRHAVVCFKKDRVDRDTLIRTFMFLGFYLVPPGSELAHPEATDIVLLVYKID